MTPQPQPSGPWYWLLRVLLPRALRDPVLGDLAEGYRHRCRVEGEAAARRWLGRECREAIGNLSGLRHGATMMTPPRPWWAGLSRDLRYSLRAVLRRPLAAVIALVTLGFGIGATTAVFSALKPALVEALPYPNADRIVLLWEREGETKGNLGYLTFDDLRRQTRSVEAVAAISFWQPTLLGGESRRLNGQRVTRDFFRVLGVAPALGRDFRADDDHPGAERVAILSHRLWRDRFAADPAIVGQAVTLGGGPIEIIGIMAEDFESLLDPTAEIWAPLRYDGSAESACRTCRHLRAVARLAGSGTIATATAELSNQYAAIAAEHPTEYASGNTGIVVEPLREFVVGPARRAYYILFAAVTTVLLLACVNVANLLLGQAVERRQEFAVRRALGAGRSRVVRQVLLESSWLGLGGAGIGILVAAIGVRWLAPEVAGALPRAGQIGLDWGVLAFAVATGIIAAFGFGAAPALITGAVSEQLRQGIGISGSRRVRRGLVVAEVGLASALLAATLLLGKSMNRLLSVDPGFVPEGLFTLDIQVAGPRFADDSTTWRYVAAVHEAARLVPGVDRAALVSQLPLGGGFDTYGLHIESRPRANPQDDPSADRYAVTPDYFETMSIPLESGRTFTAADRLGAPLVAIVSETVARLDFNGQSPIGERIRVGGTDGPGRTIVGVVADVRHHGLDHEATRQFYVPTEQWLGADGGMVLVARTRQDPVRIGPAIVAAVRALDPDPTLERPRPMTAVVGGSVGARRLVLGLFRGFALLALALSAVGVYGVMSGGVAERRREFGIRSALGEARGGLVGSVVREAIGMATLGTLGGLALWLAAAPVVRRFLYQVDASDPTSLVLVGSGLVAVAALAALRPAWRAGSQSPTTVLRSD